MTIRMRFRLQATAITVTGCTACLLLLTALHARLRNLAAFDLREQAHVHAWARPWVHPLMLGLTDIGAIRTFLVALTLVLAWLLWRGHRHAAVVLSAAIAGALLLNETLKLHFHRPRPAVPWAIGDEHTYSFPSGHALFSTVLYGTLCWLALRHGRPWWQVVPLAVLLPLAIGISRISLGEHWPTDILAGWLCGSLWLATVILVDRLYRKSHPAQHPARTVPTR